MRFTVVFLLPALTCSAFAPPASTLRGGFGVTTLKNQVTDVADDIVTRTENVLEKADDTILTRAMRFVDHAPVLATLAYFGKKAGSSRLGIDAAPSAFAGSVAGPSLLAVPEWCFYVWPIISIAQIVSVTRSSLNEEGTELSQGDISALSAANVAAATALTSDTPLRYLLLTSILSGYAARNGGDDDVSLHNAAFQLMSSFTTVAVLLGVTEKVCGMIPFLEGKNEVTAAIGLAMYYLNTARSGNGTVKKAVNAGVIGGMLWSRIAAAGGIALSTSSLLSVSLLGTAAVTFVAVQKLKDALS